MVNPPEFDVTVNAVKNLEQTKGINNQGILETLALIFLPGYVFKPMGEELMIKDLKEEVGLTKRRSRFARIENTVDLYVRASLFTGVQLAAYASVPYIVGLVSEILNK